MTIIQAGTQAAAAASRSVSLAPAVGLRPGIMITRPSLPVRVTRAVHESKSLAWAWVTTTRSGTGQLEVPQSLSRSQWVCDGQSRWPTPSRTGPCQWLRVGVSTSTSYAGPLWRSYGTVRSGSTVPAVPGGCYYSTVTVAGQRLWGICKTGPGHSNIGSGNTGQYSNKLKLLSILKYWQYQWEYCYICCYLCWLQHK